MKFSLLLAIGLMFSAAGADAAELTLLSPVDYQVVQRTTLEKGMLPISGTVSLPFEAGDLLEVRLSKEGQAADWQKLASTRGEKSFSASLEVPAGGWYQLAVRITRAGKVLSTVEVEHVGVGEIFVVAGQSNSANHGEKKLVTRTKRVVNFDGQRWQLANDPQPGASGKGGSFIPALGDALVERWDVPVAFVTCGIGATSVREWLPAGTTFPNPPTIESRVEKRADGQWVSKGDAYAMFVKRTKALGPKGFRAVLWHQGESDANQKDASRTLPGKLYREYLEKLIRDSRREIGWDAPWFVAQVSYHSPGDAESAEIREAQASLWKDNVALQGPDSDALRGDLRERNGAGVHFSEKGLIEHAARWAEKIIPVVEQKSVVSPK